MHLQRAQRWGWTLSWNLIPTTTILYTTLHNETTTRIFFLVGRRRRWYVYFHVFCSIFPICAGPRAALPVPAPRAARKKEKGFLQPERDIENAITRMGKGFGSFLWVDWRRLYICGKKRRMRCTGCLCTWQFGPRREEGFAALWIFGNDLYRGRSWARIVFFFFTTLMHFLDMCLFDYFSWGRFIRRVGRRVHLTIADARGNDRFTFWTPKCPWLGFRRRKVEIGILTCSNFY